MVSRHIPSGTSGTSSLPQSGAPGRHIGPFHVSTAHTRMSTFCTRRNELQRRSSSMRQRDVEPLPASTKSETTLGAKLKALCTLLTARDVSCESMRHEMDEVEAPQTTRWTFTFARASAVKKRAEAMTREAFCLGTRETSETGSVALSSTSRCSAKPFCNASATATRSLRRTRMEASVPTRWSDQMIGSPAFSSARRAQPAASLVPPPTSSRTVMKDRSSSEATQTAPTSASAARVSALALELGVSSVCFGWVIDLYRAFALAGKKMDGDRSMRLAGSGALGASIITSTLPLSEIVVEGAPGASLVLLITMGTPQRINGIMVLG
mmetsp:Transcript_36908/g.80977  ORF Transcript_36908/g.80977 Transcript_36908/m.80977 type:complete len:324 (+) Transcript_36908:1267-2238(+)